MFPNVPPIADKLDPQEQLKKLREVLLRDAAARESDGENEADDDAGSAVNRKKEAAARRFAEASGGFAAGASKAASGGAGTSSTAPQTAKKSVQKSAAGSPSLSRDQPKGSSSAAPSSREPAQRKDERGGLALLSTLLSEKEVGPSVSSNFGDRREQGANARVSSQDDLSATKRASSNPPVTNPAKPNVHPAADAFAQQRATQERPAPFQTVSKRVDIGITKSISSEVAAFRLRQAERNMAEHIAKVRQPRTGITSASPS
ncbi:MAG: hypothetical protein CBARDMAM_7175 [uncultured Caballeronia sp.]|nr:MAG: hypothetical protein CBARDMAM_7175 [uncultured Caballeronia sp.]